MKLTPFKSLGALAAASALSVGAAIAGPVGTYTPAPDMGSVPPPPAMSGSEGGLFDSMGMTLSAGYDTDYIFRGYDIGHDFVWTQLDLSIPLGDQLEFSVGTWYTSGYNETGNELDIYASLAYDFGAFGVEVGYTHYTYPNGWLGDGSTNGGETNEAYISAGTTVGPVDLGLSWHYDFDLDVNYFEATAATSIPLSSSVSLDPSVGISYVDTDNNTPGFDDNGWNHVFAKLEMPIKLTGAATLTPYVAVSSALDFAEDAGAKDYFWGGISLSVDF